MSDFIKIKDVSFFKELLKKSNSYININNSILEIETEIETPLYITDQVYKIDNKDEKFFFVNDMKIKKEWADEISEESPYYKLFELELIEKELKQKINEISTVELLCPKCKAMLNNAKVEKTIENNSIAFYVCSCSPDKLFTKEELLIKNKLKKQFIE